jgi:uncharacterized OB-fold protein
MSQTGTVYTETVVWSPPEAYVNDVPYQLAIVEFENGSRLTARIVGERASIGDRVVLVETRGDVQYFEKEKAEKAQQ